MEHSSLKQLNFYPPETKFFIKLKNFETGAVKVLKDISFQEYAGKYLNYCKYLNSQGYNVFLSPSVAGGCDILLDDVSIETVKRLNADGFEPLYCLETSPANFQTIIRLSVSGIIDADIQKFISKQLADIYSADPNSADPGHFFRLSGFTNRKAKYRTSSGLYPFVKLYSQGHAECSKGMAYINNIEKGIKEGLIEIELKNIRTAPLWGEKKTGSGGDTGCFDYIRRVYNTNNSFNDISVVDFKAARYALKKGFSSIAIKEAIKQLSPNLENRKKGHIEDYLNRTVKNASAAQR